MYRDVILNGCRSVELDVYYSNNELQVYHGGTRTTAISYKDIIECIGKYAFTVSDLPFCVSLSTKVKEMEQQTEMARIIKDTFGDRLITSYIKNENYVPTLDEMRNKFYIKDKFNEENDDDNDLTSDMADSTDENLIRAPELNELVIYTKSYKFKSFEDSLNRSPHECVSLSETTVKKLAEDGLDLLKHTEHQIVRTYPKGTRVWSSNYNPTRPLGTGCQMVALNWQNRDDDMHQLQTLFRFNGGSGYIPKKFFHLNSNFEGKFSPNATFKIPKIKLTIISGSRLYNANDQDNKQNAKSTVDPYVEVLIRDFNLQENESIKLEKTTSVIQNNGFNPIWNEVLEFENISLLNSYLHLKVYDKDVGKDDPLGSIAVPIRFCRAGYRTIFLEEDNHHYGFRKMDESEIFVKLEFLDKTGQLLDLNF